MPFGPRLDVGGDAEVAPDQEALALRDLVLGEVVGDARPPVEPAQTPDIVIACERSRNQLTSWVGSALDLRRVIERVASCSKRASHAVSSENASGQRPPRRGSGRTARTASCCVAEASELAPEDGAEHGLAMVDLAQLFTRQLRHCQPHSRLEESLVPRLIRSPPTNVREEQNPRKIPID